MESSESGRPGCVITQHGVEDGDHFSDASGECDLFVFTGNQEALVKAFDKGIEACGNHGTGVQRRS